MKIIELFMRESLPRKDFFDTHEITSLLHIKPQEIRYWETEFPQIRAHKTASGQRIYRRKDVILFSAIRHLLHEKKLTLSGAQRIIAQSDEMFADDTPSEQNDRAANADAFPVPMPVKADASEENAPEVEVPFVAQNLAESRENNRPNEISDNQILKEASRMLSEANDEFDGVKQEIYYHFRDELASKDVEIPAHHVGEMIKDAIAHQASKEKTRERLSKRQYEMAFSTLIQSRVSLTEVLAMLDKYRESNFWHGFKS